MLICNMLCYLIRKFLIQNKKLLLCMGRCYIFEFLYFITLHGSRIYTHLLKFIIFTYRQHSLKYVTVGLWGWIPYSYLLFVTWIGFYHIYMLVRIRGQLVLVKHGVAMMADYIVVSWHPF